MARAQQRRPHAAHRRSPVAGWPLAVTKCWFRAVTIVAGVALSGRDRQLADSRAGAVRPGRLMSGFTRRSSRARRTIPPSGRVAGALPVLMGWAAVGATLELAAFTLFLIVFLWQFPHFMAIAWIYRRRLCRRPVCKCCRWSIPSGRRAGMQAVVVGADAAAGQRATGRGANSQDGLFLSERWFWASRNWRRRPGFPGGLDERSARRLVAGVACLFAQRCLVLLLLSSRIAN